MAANERHRVALAQAEALGARAVERRDRRQPARSAHIRERKRELACDAADRLGPESELELDVVRLAVPVVVDRELVEDVRVEVPVVRPRARLLARDHVHDQRDLVLLAGLVVAEHEEVRDVRGRIECDERCFSVARRLSCLRARSTREEREEEGAEGEPQCDDDLSPLDGCGHCRLTSLTPFVLRCSHECLHRFDGEPAR